MNSLKISAIAYLVCTLHCLRVRDLIKHKVEGAEKTTEEKRVVFRQTHQCLNKFSSFEEDVCSFHCDALRRVIHTVEEKLAVQATVAGTKLVISAASAGLGGDILPGNVTEVVAEKVMLTPVKQVATVGVQHAAAGVINEACVSKEELDNKLELLVQKVLHKNEALAVTQQTFSWGSLLLVLGAAIADTATCWVDGGAATLTALSISGVIGAANTGVDLAHMTITGDEKDELKGCVEALCGPELSRGQSGDIPGDRQQ